MKNRIIGVVGLVLVTALFAGCGSLPDKAKPTEEESIEVIEAKPTEEENDPTSPSPRFSRRFSGRQ